MLAVRVKGVTKSELKSAALSARMCVKCWESCLRAFCREIQSSAVAKAEAVSTKGSLPPHWG